MMLRKVEKFSSLPKSGGVHAAFYWTDGQTGGLLIRLIDPSRRNEEAAGGNLAITECEISCSNREAVNQNVKSGAVR